MSAGRAGRAGALLLSLLMLLLLFVVLGGSVETGDEDRAAALDAPAPALSQGLGGLALFAVAIARC
jgi:hypothetical protein